MSAIRRINLWGGSGVGGVSYINIYKGLFIRFLECDVWRWQMSYQKTCPQCNDLQEYSCYTSWWNATKHNTWCRSCRQAERVNRPGEREKRRTAQLGLHDGEKNAFFGKTHSATTKQKMSAIQSSLPHHAFFGEHKCAYDYWVAKYGKEEADKRQLSMKASLSRATSGKNNPMYGKPSPMGSGYGWKGWYKGWFFRSLRELSYVVDVLEVGDHKWVPAEKHSLRIPFYQSYKRLIVRRLRHETFTVSLSQGISLTGLAARLLSAISIRQLCCRKVLLTDYLYIYRWILHQQGLFC